LSTDRLLADWTGRQTFFKITALPLALWTILIVAAAIGATFAWEALALRGMPLARMKVITLDLVAPPLLFL
jgi:hypothetical protein